jgi:HAD superfamily hydrolase (TIGR01549 family)
MMLFSMLFKPDAVVFDFGGTLFDTEFDVRKGQLRMIELAGLGSTHLDEWARIADPLARELMTGGDERLVEYSGHSLTRLVGDCLGTSMALEPAELEMEFWKASERCSMVAGVDAVVKQLCEHGVALGVLSNLTSSGAVVEHELLVHGMGGLFSCIATSTDYGIRKPHPMVFRAIAGRLQVPLERCWYIGDAIGVDVVGAQRAGMAGVWLNRDGRDCPAGIAPDAELRDWREFDILWTEATSGA